MDDMDKLLVAHGGMTALELEPADISETQRRETLLDCVNDDRFDDPDAYCKTSMTCSFWRLGQYPQSSAIGFSKAIFTLYTKLFTACWEGDNAKVKGLCLPQNGTKNSGVPIVVAVRWGDDCKGEGFQDCRGSDYLTCSQGSIL